MTKWMLSQAVGATVAIAGGVLAITGFQRTGGRDNWRLALIFGIAAFAVGLAVYGAGRFGAWQAAQKR